jgi:hypothetical protein
MRRVGRAVSRRHGALAPFGGGAGRCTREKGSFSATSDLFNCIAYQEKHWIIFKIIITSLVQINSYKFWGIVFLVNFSWGLFAQINMISVHYLFCTQRDSYEFRLYCMQGLK